MVCGWGRGKRMWRFKHWYFDRPWYGIDREERIRTLEQLRDELEAELEDIRKEIERLKG